MGPLTLSARFQNVLNRFCYFDDFGEGDVVWA